MVYYQLESHQLTNSILLADLFLTTGLVSMELNMPILSAVFFKIHGEVMNQQVKLRRHQQVGEEKVAEAEEKRR